MTSFETRTARAAMNGSEIKKFVADFEDALMEFTSLRIKQTDIGAEAFARKFDDAAGSLDWTDADVLATGGIDPSWIEENPRPHRAFLHPHLVTHDAMWSSVRDYLEISMVSEKFSKILFPNLARKRKPTAVSSESLLDEARSLNKHLRLVQESGLSSYRVRAYRRDLKTHGQRQNDSWPHRGCRCGCRNCGRSVRTVFGRDRLHLRGDAGPWP